MKLFKNINAAKAIKAKINARINFLSLVTAALFMLPLTAYVYADNALLDAYADGDYQSSPKASNASSAKAASAQINARNAAAANLKAATLVGSALQAGTTQARTLGNNNIQSALNSAGVANPSQYMLPANTAIIANSTTAASGYVAAGTTLAGATNAQIQASASLKAVNDNYQPMVYERDKINDLWQEIIQVAPPDTTLTADQITQKIALQMQILNILNDVNQNPRPQNPPARATTLANDAVTIATDMSLLINGQPTTTTSTDANGNPNTITTYSAPAPIDDGTLEDHVGQVLYDAGVISSNSWTAPTTAPYADPNPKNTVNVPTSLPTN
jgi:hypothetical protein